MTDCSTKKRYPTKKMADVYVNSYNKDVFLKDNDMLTSYYCKYHEGWHVGHENLKTLPPHIKIQKILDKIKKDKNE